MNKQNINEFTVHFVFSASMNIFLQKTLSQLKNYFNEEFNLERDGRVAMSEIIVPEKNQVNKNYLKILPSEGGYYLLKILTSRKFYEKNILFDVVSRRYRAERYRAER